MDIMITLPKQLTAVTLFSKIVAFILFVAFPFIGFVLGVRYQTLLCKAEGEAQVSITPTLNGVVCTMDAKMCPDGSYVSRIPPTCEFAPCPTAK